MVANRREIRYRTANLLQADNDGTRLLNSFATVPKTATTYGDITVSPTGIMTVVASNSSTTGKTLASSDMNSTINSSGTITVNNSVATAGDIVIVHNSTAGGISINDGSDGASGITTMRLAGTATTGTRTLAQRGVAFLYFATATEVIVGGSGIS